MLPLNILYRTFFIKGAEYGTAFTIDVGDEQFLITAAHLLAGRALTQVIQIYRAKQWHPIDCTLVGIGAGELDIAVLKVPIRLTDAKLVVEYGFRDCHPGQDFFFAGFPYKMWIDYGGQFTGIPIPFLKKGTLSACDLGPPKTLYIDALNNEGFSGAPLYFFVNGDLGTPPRIAGVVSKFRIEFETVIDLGGDPTVMKVPYNTGFLIAYDIAHALQLVKG